ncbi:puratrophin-1-like isoform X2 [Homalodisca vitripennis]|nr:puratrophin-1-like isoform X2 [Homalodisca vitripennis]
MAYVVWRVVMKKYAKVRLGLTHRGGTVTPSERSQQDAKQRQQETSFSAEGAWTAGPEFAAKTPDEGLNKIDDFNRIGSNKSLSRSKRVKSFIQKKCKDFSNSFGSSHGDETPELGGTTVVPRSKSTSRANSELTTTSWYVANDYHSDEEVFSHVTVVKVGVEVRDTQNVTTVAIGKQELVKVDEPDSVEVSDTVDSRNEGGTDLGKSEETLAASDCDDETFVLAQDNTEEEIAIADSDIPKENLNQKRTNSEETVVAAPILEPKTEIERLTDQYFGHLYSNYHVTRPVLVRQARDLLVCSYHGNTARFEAEFCQPAAAIMAEVIQRSVIEVASGLSPRGWPLSLGSRGVVLHLGELDSSLLRSRDCYLCVRVPQSSAPQVALVWPGGSRATSPPPSALAMMTAAEELPDLLHHLVVSVERAIERVPLDDLPFPCPQCHECLADQECVSRCQCATAAEKRDSCMQTSPMYELDASIPHIDSDEEHDDDKKHSLGRTEVLVVPRCIAEVSEKLLMSGIYLPGVHDQEGRAVVVYDAAVVARAALSHTDVARVILYYSTLPVRPERTVDGLTVVAVNCSSPTDGLHFLDKSLASVTLTQRVALVLSSNPQQPPGLTTLPLSKTKCHIVSDANDLLHFIPEDQTPSECGGRTTHDQLEWVEFFKELEPFISSCQACGRRLVGVMSDVRSAVDGTLSRRQLSSQHRTMSRVLHDSELQRLRRDGHTTLAALEDRAQWLPDNEDVRLGVERAERLFSEVDRAAKRLEELSDKRRERLRDLSRMRALEDETSQVLTWLNHKGEDSLKRHAKLASTLPAIKQQEQDFEKFYFISMRHLDKGGDLLEEASQVSGHNGNGLRDLARSLKNHLRGFSERLEDTRERLEDTSRCFYLLDKAYEWALEAMKYMSRVKPEDAQNPEPSVKQLKQYLMAHPPLPQEHFTEMLGLAQKLHNDKLIEQCKVAQCRCEETMEQVRSVLGGEPPAMWTSTPLPGRRRSLPSPHPSPPTCPCWSETPTLPTPPLDHIREECYCPPHPLQRSCTWQYPTEHYDDEDNTTSSADNTTEGSEAGTKSGEDMEEHGDACGKPVAPIAVNSHLHCDLSLQMDNMQGGTQTLKTKKTMLLIMREMIQTERDYVKSLEYVIENYIPELIREDIPQALRGQRNVIFGNIEKIYEFHSQFFLQELERCEQTPLSIGQCFLRHEKKFYLYALYNKNKPKSDSLMSEYGTVFFKTKQMELGDKMDLASYLLKPVQRMGKYALLLQQLMKASRQDVADLRDAEKMVRFQLRHGNDLLAMDSLRDCDVNVKEQGRLLRQNEFLVWQGKGKKCLRQVFLFEELILFSKARRFPDRKNLDIYIYKNSIKTSDIGLTAKIGDSPTKFEIWFRKRKPNDTFTLQSMSEDIKQVWADELSNLLWKQAVKNREMRLQEMSSMGIGNKPCLDIRPSADQISDRSISIAQLSKTPRFRNSIAIAPSETVRKRPHSIISVSSSSGASSSSSSEHRLHHSQCSSAESGIVSDWHTSTSIASDSTSPSWPEQH